MTELTFEPLIPGALWLALATAAAALLLWYAFTRPPAIGPTRWWAVLALMTTAITAVLVLLLNITRAKEMPSPAGKPMLTVLIDDSASMSTPDTAGGITRFAAAAKIATNLAAELSNRFDVRLATFDQTVRTISPDLLSITTPVGNATDIAGAITNVLNQDKPQGQAVVLLSDGIDTGAGSSPVLEAVRTAKAMGAPIYTRTFGGDVKSIALSVDIPLQQDLAVVGQKVPVAARIHHVGIAAGLATIRLFQGATEIDHRDALLSPDTDTQVSFLVSQPKVGVYPYEIRVDPVPGQTSQENNSAAYALRVVSEPVRVLLLEGKPYWDSKFLTRTLMNDPAVVLDCIVRLNDSRLLRRTLSHLPAIQPSTQSSASETQRTETWKIETDASAILASSEQLRNYQLIIIGRDAEPFLNDAAISNLQHWVSQQGGSLLCYRGSPTSASNQLLAKLLPVKWTPASASRFRVQMTDQGKSLNWFPGSDEQANVLAQMPSLAAGATESDSKPLAVVLASAIGVNPADHSAALVYQPYGSGRVAVIEGAGMWRWAFLAPQYQQQDAVYGSLWHSLVRWLSTGQGLSPAEKFSLCADKVRFATGEPVTATLLARQEISRDQLPAIQLQQEGSPQSQTFYPAPLGSESGVFRVNFGPLSAGRYHAQLAAARQTDPSQQIVFEVRQYDQEMLDLQARPDLMARIAADSGGAVLSQNPVAELAQKFDEHQAQAMPPRIERSSAWDRWWILCAVLGCWVISWSIRRAGGLI